VVLMAGSAGGCRSGLDGGDWGGREGGAFLIK
jgi:hypothetical protein